METQSIVVLDFGAQYSQLIARRIRELNVFSVVLPCTASLEEIRSYSPVGIILSGGPSSVYDKDAPVADPAIFDLGLPVLGICYGLQFMVHQSRRQGASAPTSASTATPTLHIEAWQLRVVSRACRRICPSGCRTATKPSNCLPASS